MCGIGGSIGAIGGRPADETDIAALMKAIRHRGPDDDGIWCGENGRVILGFNRLSIIDLSPAGHQPMVNPANGDVLVFNGEIYNYLELKEELAAKGHRFRSRSDTEVLLLALGEWGMAALSRIQGMYAFALWRPSDNTLTLARDPLGIKPLYVWPQPDGRGLAFSSEIRGFFALPGASPVLDRRALRQFLEFGYTFDSERTCIAGIQKVPPGHVMQIGGDDLRCRLWRHYAPPLDAATEPAAAPTEEELYETLSKVVRQHLIADVPVGLLLSGGLDSSILAARAARHAQVKTISMGFAESTLDERPYAQAVADHLGSDHEAVLITQQDVQDSLGDGIGYFDDLFADWGTVSTRLLYAKCRERGVKVVIVGEGSDELFGGYDVFRRSFSRAPQELWLFQLYRAYAGRRYGRLYGRFRAIMLDQLRACGGDRFAAIRLFETQQQLPNNYVMKVDKASMAVSVEARVPFLDRRVADIAYRTPRDQLLADGTEKVLLRRMARKFGLLPESILQRRKLGGSMAASWMDDQATWRSYAREIILDSGAWTRELGLRPAMEAYFVGNRSGYRPPHPLSIFRNLAWRLLILELWAGAHGMSPNAA
jgi:asparagine synthase (glutamine-hydrolysing)